LIKKQRKKKITLSEEFKDLYIQMIKYFPDERIESKNILNHPWFNEIKIMKKEKKEEYDNLVNEINKELEELAPKIKENNLKTIIGENKEVGCNSVGKPGTGVGKREIKTTKQQRVKRTGENKVKKG